MACPFTWCFFFETIVTRVKWWPDFQYSRIIETWSLKFTGIFTVPPHFCKRRFLSTSSKEFLDMIFLCVLSSSRIFRKRIANFITSGGHTIIHTYDLRITTTCVYFELWWILSEMREEVKNVSDNQKPGWPSLVTN